MDDQPKDSLSPTARETKGTLPVGKSQGQRSAEIVAGIRAELMPTPEYIAMSRVSGRVAASLILRLGRGDNQAKIHVVAALPIVFGNIIEQELHDKPNAHFVELAAGFLPRGLQLARKFPTLRVTEIDLPEVMAEKRSRIQRAGLAVPGNITWLSADLAIQTLGSLLGEEKVDIIAAQGLLSYLALPHVSHVIASVRAVLRPGGLFVADITHEAGVRVTSEGKAKTAISMFQRNAGKWLGTVRDEQHARDLFMAEGFSSVEVHPIKPLAEALPNVPKPVYNIVFVVVARA